jgi:hypothetical protein
MISAMVLAASAVLLLWIIRPILSMRFVFVMVVHTRGGEEFYEGGKFIDK